jgi:hypothetical protein
MARKAGGADQLAAARGLLRTAKTADELRTAQAVVLPLELGLSLEQTATAIGRSVGATCALRTRYCKVARRERAAPRPKRALRNRAHATLEREAQILDEVLAGTMRGGRRRSAAQGERRGAPGQAGGALDDLSHARAQRLAQAGPGHGPPARRCLGSRGLEKNSRGSWTKS